jgi:putative serine protease PepD
MSRRVRLPAGAEGSTHRRPPAQHRPEVPVIRHRLIPFTAATVLALGLAACSSSPTSTGSVPPTGSSVPASPGATVTPPPNATPLPAPVGTGIADQLEQEYVAVVHQVGPSVVVIQTSGGLGSGVIFDAKGDIVTNAHVAAGATTYRVTLADGRSFPATLVGSFTQDDLAVLHIAANNLHPAVFADSSKLQVGDIVLAIGNPLGLQSSVTEGIVSALNRTVSEPGGVALPSVIQTSAAINPGNSGGALVDLSGQVIGIPTLTATDPQIGGAAPGIGFAIPSNLATDIANQLIAHGHVVNSHRAYLGIQGADTFGGSGVYVYSVAPGGPADQAGLVTGEVITAVDGQQTPDNATLDTILAGKQPGDKVSLSILHRDGTSATVTVTLGEFPG